MDMICKIGISRHQQFWLPVTNSHWRKDRELLYEAANCLQIGNFKTGKFKLAHREVSIETGRSLCQPKEILFSEKVIHFVMLLGVWPERAILVKHLSDFSPHFALSGPDRPLGKIYVNCGFMRTERRVKDKTN